MYGFENINDDFIIDIDENSFDLIIYKYSNNKYGNKDNDGSDNKNFFQYVWEKNNKNNLNFHNIIRK